MKAKGCDVKLNGNDPGFTLPSNIGELGDDITTLSLSSCSLRGAALPIIPPPTKANCGRHESDEQIAHAGPPLGETLQLLKPLASTLEKLDLRDNKLGGTLTEDISAYGKLTELRLSGMGIGGACVCRYVPSYHQADRARKQIDMRSRAQGRCRRSLPA